MAKKPIPPGKAYGYIRASTEEQQTTLHAQEDQIKACYEYKLQSAGYEWGGCYIESGITASKPLANREIGMRMLTELRPGDVVVMQKADRGWRNMLDCLATVQDWSRRGIRLIFTTFDIDTGSLYGDIILKVMAMVAELERTMMCERMRHFHARRRAEGKKTAVRKYGFKTAGPKGRRVLVPDPFQRIIGAKLLEWYMAGWTQEQIMKHCHKKEIIWPLTGAPPNLTCVQNIIKREAALQKEEKANRVRALEDAKGAPGPDSVGDEDPGRSDAGGTPEGQGVLQDLPSPRTGSGTES